MINTKNKYKVTNPYLKSILFGSYRCPEVENKLNIPGYFNTDDKFLSRSLLTHCVDKIFNIHRLPGFEETYRSDDVDCKRNSFKNLYASDLEGVYSSLEELYNHTKNFLKGKRKLFLYRWLARHEIYQVYKQILSQKSEISFFTNTVVSHTTNKRYYDHRPILLKHYVDIENILTFYEGLLYPEEEEYKSCMVMAEEEVLVINKDPFGRISEPLENFEMDEKVLSQWLNRNTYDNYTYEYKYDLDDSYEFITEDIRSQRPCNNKYIKFLIKMVK